MTIIGIDLAGSPKRNTGFAILRNSLKVETRVLHTNKEIIKKTLALKPKIISIDAPLCLPKGRKNLEDRNAPHLRKCDRQLQKMKIKFFPVTLGPMRKLTARGIKLKNIFEKKGFEVIESYPGSAQDVLNMPRKGKGLEKLRKALIDYGFTGDVGKKEITHDELDAITSALVGKFYIEGNYLALGDPKEGLMILPPKKQLNEW